MRARTIVLCWMVLLFSFSPLANQIQQLFDPASATVQADSAEELDLAPSPLQQTWSCDSVTQIPTAECEALVALYNSTNGPGWTDDTGWLQTNTPCAWYRVWCEDRSGQLHVVGVGPYYNNLSGPLPAELGNLTYLEVLRLTGNHLTGSIPSELGNLAYLEDISLSDNPTLSGAIPPELGNLTNLWWLNVDNCNLSGGIPAELANLTNLQYLFMDNNQINGSIPVQFGSLARLEELHLAGNQLSGSIPSTLGSLTNLRRLDLARNQFSGAIPSELGNMTMLYRLYLDHNRLTGTIPSSLGNRIHLGWLNLSHNALRGPVPDSITNLTSLQSLDLGYNAFYSSNPATRSFLNQEDPDWDETQTVAPSILLVTRLDLETYHLDLTPILYTADGGYYEIEYATDLGGPFTAAPPTADKTVDEVEIGGLTAGMDYYFRARTYTPAHSEQQNELWSDYSPIAAENPFYCLGDTIPDEECLALVSLYQATEGPSWTNHTGWLESPDPCTWYGVSCTGGHVTTIDLDVNQLTGTLPPDLANLGDLEILDLRDNQISGPLPSWLGSLNRLEILNLGYNGFTGSIPPQLSNLANLTSLNLGVNQLTGSIPAELGNLTALNSLSLFFNQLSGTIPVELGSLHALTNLDLNVNQLTGPIPAWLGELTSLNSLGLLGNHFSGSIPPELGSLTNLTYLALSHNRLSGTIPAELGNLTGLTHLGLSYNQLAGEVPDSITNLTALIPWSLYLDYNGLTATVNNWDFLNSRAPNWATTQTRPPDLEVRQLGPTSLRLTVYAIPYTAHGGYYEIQWATNPEGPFEVYVTTPSKAAAVYELTGLTAGTRYYFRVRTFTPAHDAQQNDIWSAFAAPTPEELQYCYFGQELDDCAALLALFNATNGWAWTNHTGWLVTENPATWYGILNAGVLFSGIDLHNNHLTGSLPAELVNLANLQTLNLSDNQIAGSIPASYGDLSSLKYLSLDHNQLSGNLPSSLGGLSTLEQLDLSNNALSGVVPDSLTALTQLTSLDLGYNALTASPSTAAFLASKDPDWAATQTVPPSNLAVTEIGSDQVTLSWTPILFTGGGGYYAVEAAASLNGPYTQVGTTASKTASSYTVTGLDPQTTCYLRVRTHTPTHGGQQNALWSGYTEPVEATTVPEAQGSSVYLPLVIR